MSIAPKALCLVAFAGFGFSPAYAQGPQRTIAIYDDWTVSCSMGANNLLKSCELTQAHTPQGQTNPISQITFSRPTREGPFKASFQVPPNVWLQAGVNFGNDKDTVVVAMFKWCIPSRCLADAELSDANLKKLSVRTEPASLLWKDAAQHDLTAPVSLNGFSSALNAMNDALSSRSLAMAENVRRFDGQWSTEAECQAIPPNVLKTSWKTTSKIENGKVSAKFGDEGRPGSGKFEGVINADGQIELAVNGLSGDSKYNSNNAPEKTPYTWRAKGSFSGLQGTAKKMDGRFCTVSFSKNG